MSNVQPAAPGNVASSPADPAFRNDPPMHVPDPRRRVGGSGRDASRPRCTVNCC